MMEVCMTLNIAIVSGGDSGNGQLMVDPIGQSSPLPIDVARIIFQNLKSDLPTVALVCKNWKALADDEVFRKMIRPAQAFGSKEWTEYIKVDAGVELPLPRRAYGDLEKEDGLLTYIPEKVKVIENGEEVSLYSLEAIGNLVKKPITDLETCYTDDSWWDEDKRKLEKPHWVWIKKEVIGRGLQYAKQQNLAREENKKACGANISGLIDTTISVIMEYARSRERNFIWDPYKMEATFVRANDETDYGGELGLCFTPTGLGIGSFDNIHVGIVIARKYYGTCSSSTKNIAIVSGRDSDNGQHMADPIGQNSPLPIDVARIIFQNLKSDLPSVALVCKNWKALADDDVFRKMIRPAQAFGTQEWKEYMDVDAGEEPRLPRRAYGDLEKYDDLLTFIPEKVKVIENGKEVLLDNLEVIGKLVGNPKKGNKTGYTQNSWQEAISEKRKQEKPHWVWIKKEVIGRNETYKQQQKLIAKEENRKAPGAHISGLIDTAISVFMEYIRLSEGRIYFWSPPVHCRITFVRVNEQTDGYPLRLGFGPSSLYVYSCDFDIAVELLAVATARKSFGHFA